MKYVVEPIGAEFSNRDLPKLAERFTAQARNGYRLHSVFQAQQPGCMGMGQPTITYLAIYERDE